MVRRFAVPLVALAAVVASAAPAAAADAWDVPPSATITIDGHGHGHGRGMSQYGAVRAADLGTGYRRIVEYYYPGTGWGTTRGQVRVWLSKGDIDNAVKVQARSGLVAAKVGGSRTWSLAKAKPRAKSWRILPKGDRASVLEYQQGGWHQYRRIAGQLEFSAHGKPIRLYRNDRTSGTYRGVLRSVPSSTGNRITVNVLSMESYLRGVVPAEMIASTFPQQALRAQAVASRSYAAAKRATRTAKPYDVDDTPASQHYQGAGAEYAASDTAVRATAGEILTYDGAPAFTEFGASSGGWTVAGDEPYLTAMPDQWDSAADPNHAWRVTFSDAEIENAWPSIGDLTHVGITGRDGHGEWGGRAGTVTLTGTGGIQSMTGTAFYQGLGLRSPWLTLTVAAR